MSPRCGTLFCKHFDFHLTGHNKTLYLICLDYCLATLAVGLKMLGMKPGVWGSQNVSEHHETWTIMIKVSFQNMKIIS